jgi:hypothetical protein
MKKVTQSLLALLLAALPVTGFAAAADVLFSQKNSSNTAWANVIVAPTASSALAFNSSKVPISTQALTLSSVTSPAGNNLTLGLGTGGTALTLTSGTLAATFAGVVVVTDGSAAAPSLVVSSSPTTGFYRHGSGAIGFSSAGLASAAFSSNSGGGGLYLEALGTNQNIRVVPSGTGVFTTASPVTFTNSTAGSASAGALVVTGGLATGGASYFGGAVTVSTSAVAADFTSSANLGATVKSTGAVYNPEVSAFLSPNMLTFGVGGYSKNYFGVAQTAYNSGVLMFSYAGAGSTSNSFGLGIYGQEPALRINGTGAATFAGAVTVPSLFMSTDAQGSVLSSSGNTLFIDAAAGGMTVRPKAGSVFHVSNSAPVRFSAYGAGAATFDSSGNITSVSDARLKNITGTFTKGLAEIVKLTPKLYTWKPETGLVTDDINATLIAQDLIAAGLSEAVATYRTVPVMEDDVQSAEDLAAGKPVTQHAKLDANGKAVTKRVDANYSVSDRTVIAALVNAVKELKAEIDALKAAK